MGNCGIALHSLIHTKTKKMIQKKSPFTIYQNSQKEIFTTEFSKQPAKDLIFAILAVALVYGIERTESAIDNTWAKDDSVLIKTALNFILKTY